ncbi:hypothetical protein DL98DRAFT_611830 [Cadophora sp. DSE1049]|nr:hypothetical protein DL98DRAFT_611830 [Cadophora sp. DSE1049]
MSNNSPQVQSIMPSGALPLHGSYIIFPLQQSSIINVEWAQNDCWHSAPYYQIRCFWSHDPNFTETKSSMNQSVIFIAQEYFEDRYMDKHAILQFAATKHVKNTGSKIWEHFGESPKDEDKWARAQLTEEFCFGQNQEKTFRWMVYHPKERTIYQGRFLKGLRQLTVERGLGVLGMIKASGPPLMGGVTFNFDETAVQRLGKFGITLAGDELHVFKAAQDVPDVKVGKVISSLKEQEAVRAEYVQAIMKDKKLKGEKWSDQEIDAAAGVLMGARGEFFEPAPPGCSIM